MHFFFYIFGTFEIVLLAILLVSFVVLHKTTSGNERRFHKLAVTSFITGIFNPTVISTIYHLLGFPLIGRGDSELRSWIVGTFALVAGIVAYKKINKNKEIYEGKVLAAIGMITGGAWSIGWVVLILWFALSYGLVSGPGP